MPVRHLRTTLIDPNKNNTMNREIKFRAWDIEAKQFVTDFILDRLGNEYQTNKCEFWGDDRRLVLMQYTGMKDKNGMDIYEGDIVQMFITRSWGRPEQETVRMVATLDDGIWNVATDWIEASEWWGAAEDGSTTVHWREIIGNVHEDPELLKP